MKEEIERINLLLGFNYFMHERIYMKSSKGYISKDEAMKVMWRNHNIPKEECLILIRSLEVLGLLEDEGKYFKVIKPEKDSEEFVFELKKKLKMIN
jgi:hypothetical protein